MGESQYGTGPESRSVVRRVFGTISNLRVFNSRFGSRRKDRAGGGLAIIHRAGARVLTPRQAARHPPARRELTVATLRFCRSARHNARRPTGMFCERIGP